MITREISLNSERRQLSHNVSFLHKVSAKYIISSGFSMLAVYAGALIDTVLIGAFLGEKGLSAISLVSPVYLFYYTAGAIIGIGGSVAASHFIGNGDYRGYRRIFTCSLICLLALAIIMTAGGLLFLDSIVIALDKGSGNALWVKEYLRYYILGGGFTLLAYIPMYFLKTDGRSRTSSVLFFLYTILNVALTWLLMSSAFHMGIGGAALATAISMAALTVIGFFILFDGKGESGLAAGSLTLANIKTIMIAGMPSGLANLFEAIRILLINTLLLGIGAVYLLPVFTVVRNILDLLNAVMIGISSALLPIISVFFSEEDYNSVRKVFHNVMRIGVIVSAVLSLIVSSFPGVVAFLFGISDTQTIHEIQLALPLACGGTLIAYINTQFTGYYNTILRTSLSNLILFLRHIVFLTFSTLLLSNAFHTEGIWFGFSVSEFLTLATIYLMRAGLRKRTPDLDRFLLDTGKEYAADITFSVQNNEDDIMFASNKITEFCEDNEISMKIAMKISLAIEEILKVIIVKCMDSYKASYIDIRVKKLEDGALLRIRNAGQIFDPVRYYEEHIEDAAHADELLGLKIIIGSCKQIDFRKTFGVNNLMIVF